MTAPIFAPISAADYHADAVADTPSLSSSIAHILCTQSPAHARTAHPRLNPDYQRKTRDVFDLGTAVHAMFLEGDSVAVVVDAPDWKTKAAQEAREEARANGQVAMLAKDLSRVTEMVSALHRQLGEHSASPPLFEDGKPEQTLVWNEGDVVCRARLDWLRDDFAAIDDLKTTSKSASPEAYSRALFSIGGDVQAAFYLRGLEAATGDPGRASFRWVVIETTPPYALSVVAPGQDVLTVGRKKVDYAIELWRKCLADDHWPGYPTDIAYAELPAWSEAQWLAKEEAMTA